MTLRGVREFIAMALRIYGGRWVILERLPMSVFDSVNWGVHIVGPDSVLAAKDFTEAVEQCDRINRNLVRMQPEFDSNLHPILWAKVEVWGDISAATHEPEKTNWDEVC